nr:unnamed protein product [Spirometra erinaceieuropaei]
MIAAVESILSHTEATEETKSLIRHQVSSLLMAHRPREVLSKVERDALRELKADKDLVIVPADKGRSTVVLDRTDYLQKAKVLLEDRQFYVPCATNPVKALTREINATLLALENSGAITPTDRRMARPQDTALARFYGLPKVHKDSAPLRPIVSLKGTPTYGLAKWLFRRLKFLTAESDTTVSSSAEFLEKLKGDLAIETIELLLQSKYDETENRLGRAQVLQLLKLCLRTYFTFDGTIYEGHTNGFVDFGIHRRGGPATVRVAGLPTPQTEILGSTHRHGKKRLESFIGSGAVADKATTSEKPEDSSEREWPNTLQQCGEMTPALKLRLIRRVPATFKFDKAEILARGDNRVSRELLESWFTGPQSINKCNNLPIQYSVLRLRLGGEIGHEGSALMNTLPNTRVSASDGRAIITPTSNARDEIAVINDANIDHHATCNDP